MDGGVVVVWVARELLLKNRDGRAGLVRPKQLCAKRREHFVTTRWELFRDTLVKIGGFFVAISPTENSRRFDEQIGVVGLGFQQALIVTDRLREIAFFC